MKSNKILGISIIIVMLLGSLYPATHGGPSLNVLSDNFTQDSSLNPGLWQINAAPGATVANVIGPSAVLANTVTPSLSFSNANGMAVTGVSGQDQSSTIQSVQTFTAPFTAQATVMSPAAYGNPFVFFITTSDGGTGAGLIGNLNPLNAPFYGLWEITGRGVGNQWCCVGPTGTNIIPSPGINIQYQLRISVDSNGLATLSASSGGGSGSTTAQVGTGPFYLNLAQYEGAPNPLGPNEADWQSVSVTGSSTPSLIGPVINTGCTANSLPCQVTLAPGPNPDFTTTYSQQAQTTYLYAATGDGSNSVSWIPCCSIGFDYIGLDLAATGQNGVSSVIIGHSFGNEAWATYSNNGALVPVAGGAGVEGQYSQAISFNNQGQSGLSGTFSLSVPAEVVLVSAGSNLGGPSSLTGPFVVDGAGSKGGSIVFGDGNLASGQYSFSVSYQAGSDLGPTAIGVMLYVFQSSGQSLALPFSLSFQGNLVSYPGAVQLTSGGVTLGNNVLPLAGSSNGQCENESSIDLNTLCFAQGTYFPHLAGANVQVGSYFMSIGGCYSVGTGVLDAVFVPGWPPYCSGPTQITFGLNPCNLTHIDLPQSCAITGQILATISATGTIGFSQTGTQVTISATGTAVETIPGSVTGTSSSLVVASLFALSDVQGQGILSVYLQVNKTKGAATTPIEGIPIELQSSLGSGTLTSISGPFLGINGVIHADFDLTGFSGTSFTVKIMTTSYQGMLVSPTKNPLVFNLNPRSTDLAIGTTLSGSVAYFINAEGDVTNQFTVTNDGTNVLGISSLEQWKAGIGVDANLFKAKLGVIKLSVGGNLQAGVLSALNYRFGQPIDQTQSQLVQNLITEWALSNLMVVGGPASAVAGAYKTLIDYQNSQLGLDNYLTPTTVGAYASASFDASAKLGFGSKSGVLGVRWPGSINGQLGGSVQVSGKLNVYPDTSSLGVEVDQSFTITADASLGFMGIANLGIGGSVGAQVGLELIYNLQSGQLTALRLSVGLSASESVLKGIKYLGLASPLQDLGLNSNLSGDATLTVEYDIPLTQLESQLQSDLNSLSEGDVGSSLGGVFGIYQLVENSVNTLLRTPIPYTVSITNSTSSSIGLGIKEGLFGFDFSFSYDKSTTSVIRTGFLFNGQNWPVAAYSTVPHSISDVDFVKKYWLCQNGCPYQGTSIQKQVTTHDLYLHVIDSLGRETGLNYTSGQIQTGIPGSFYYDNLNGTSFIVLPLNVTVFKVTVDGSFARNALESYRLTIFTLNGSTTLGEYANNLAIFQGTSQSFNVTFPASGPISVAPLPQIMVSGYFTTADPIPLPLPIDASGNPKVDVVLSNGRVMGTNPGQVLAWVQTTNIGPSQIQSLKLSETLPIDWTLHPTWLPSTGAIHIYFEFLNGTIVDITNSSSIAVTSRDPEQIFVSISNLNGTASRTSLGFGASILVSAKIGYSLKGTSQAFSGYPRTYNETSNVTAWTQPSYGSIRAAGVSTAFFKTYAKVNGDVNGDGVVNILDLALVANSFGARPGGPNWNSALDVMNHGVIDITDLAYVASYLGNHA